MALRIQNLSGRLLRLDLRGGQVMHLKPDQIGPPLREESLYDNPYVAAWEKHGMIRRLRVGMEQVTVCERLAAMGKSMDDVLEDLQRVAEVGPAAAHELVSRGIVTVAEVAEQDQQTLVDVKGIGETEADQILKSAKKLTGRRSAPPKRKKLTDGGQAARTSLPKTRPPKKKTQRKKSR